MIYVLDSSGISMDASKPSKRVLAWHAVFEDQARYVAETDLTEKLSREDVVYAHTPTDFDIAVANDAVPDSAPLQKRIKHFRQMLNSACLANDAPQLIMFSGGEGFSDESQNQLKSFVSTIALPGYPIERMSAIKRGLSQSIEQADLRSIIDDHWGVGTFAGNEVAQALALLCEASDIVIAESDRLSSFSSPVHAPATPAEWFKPFGLVPSQTNADQIAAMLPSNRGRAAQDLLYAVIAGKDTHLFRQAYLKQIRSDS